MVTQLGWESLQVRRVKIRLLLIFKIQHNLVAKQVGILSTQSGTAQCVPELLHGTGCCCCRWKVVPFPDGSWEKGVSVDILPG
jgi:hypothetical protein